MTAFESTRRDLVLIRGLVFVPVAWSQVGEGDAFLGPGGRTWHIRELDRIGDYVRVTACLGRTDATVDKHIDDPVHVLDDSTGIRLAEYEGAEAVRRRKIREA